MLRILLVLLVTPTFCQMVTFMCGLVQRGQTLATFRVLRVLRVLLARLERKALKVRSVLLDHRERKVL